MPQNVAVESQKPVIKQYAPQTSPKTIAFETMISNGVDPHVARKATGVSPSAFYKNQRRKEVTAITDKYSLKSPERVSLAVKSIDKIAKGKWEGAKPSDVLSACKMIMDRAQPINEPVSQSTQQFIQINVDSLSKAVQAINSMPCIDVAVTPQNNTFQIPNPEIQIPKTP